MAVNGYKLSTVNLFEDLKQTNIKNEDFKQIVATYNKLGADYIKNNQADLFKDLNKQKEVIFSYLPNFKKESLKKIAHLQKQLEAELGNIDEIATFQTPEKQVQFVKVAYNNGKWTITAKHFDQAEFSKTETPQAINCLVNLVNRLDEQEAAYALCHAKKAGLFTMAELPYVRTEDFTNTALETRYQKDPGTVLGPTEHSYNSLDNANMPVSRQKASEEDEIAELDSYQDKDGDTVTISTISGDAVITFDNDIYTKKQVEDNIKSGLWTKVTSASKDDIRLKRIEKEFERICIDWEKKLELDEVGQRVKNEFNQKVDDKIGPEQEKLDEAAAAMLPKLQKLAAKLDSITFQDKKGYKNFQRMKYKIGKLIVNFSRGVDKYQLRAISDVEKVEELLEQAKDYVSPKNLKAFEENIVAKFFYYTSKAESFSLSLDMKDPRNEEVIQDKVKKLKKEIKMSQNNFLKDAAYDYLDKMIIAGEITFDQYNTLSDLAEMDAKPVLASLKTIRANYRKPVKSAGDNVFKSIFKTLKNWVTDALSYLFSQEKEILDINEKLDEIIPEGE